MIGLFFAALLALTFLSNTIQGMSLQKVAVEKPGTGELDLNVSGDGFLRAAYTARLYSEGDWKVVDVHVGNDDRVKKGDPLVTFDVSSARRSLEDEKARYEQLKLQLDKMGDQLKMALRNEETDNLVNLKRDYESKQLDMAIEKRKIDDLKKQIAEGETLKSPVDGVITALNASEGAVSSRGQPVVEIADDASGYRFSIVADSNDASPLNIGDKVKVRLDETQPRTIEGTITDIEDAASGGGGSAGANGSDGSDKKITFEAKDPKLEPGLKAFVDITHQSQSFGMLIPKSVLEQDNDGFYVFTVKEKDGPLGTAYYVSKTYVTIRDENEDTVVTDGLLPDDEFVTESSEPISDGDRVRY